MLEAAKQSDCDDHNACRYQTRSPRPGEYLEFWKGERCSNHSVCSWDRRESVAKT